MVYAIAPTSGIEVSASVLAAFEIIPIPARALLVIMRYFLHLKCPGLSELRGQDEGRELGGEGVG